MKEELNSNSLFTDETNDSETEESEEQSCYTTLLESAAIKTTDKHTIEIDFKVNLAKCSEKVFTLSGSMQFYMRLNCPATDLSKYNNQKYKAVTAIKTADLCPEQKASAIYQL